MNRIIKSPRLERKFSVRKRGDTFKSMNGHLYYMGRKRTKRNLWVIFLSLIGISSIVFNETLASLPVLNIAVGGFYVFLGIAFIIIALVIGLNR